MSEKEEAEIAALVRSLSANERVVRLLDLCVGRILVKACRREEDWRKLTAGRDLRHVADWIEAAVVNGAAWLGNVDDLGRQKKLMKFGSLDVVVKEADKAMKADLQRMAAGDVDDAEEKTVAVLSSGYRVVKMLTPQALDRESAEMQHCVGTGGYDRFLESGERTLLSLRDPSGKPHVTFEVHTETFRIVQMQGKQNSEPTLKYLELSLEAIHVLGLNTTDPAFVFDRSGRPHLRAKLPRVLEVGGSLDVSADRYRRRRRTDAAEPPETLPDELSVDLDLNITRRADISALPRVLEVGRSLYLGWTGVRLFELVSLGGDLWMNDTPVARLPEGLRVGGALSIGRTRIEAWPEGISVGKDIYAYQTHIRDWSRVRAVEGHFDLEGSLVGVLAEGLRVKGTLSLAGTALKSLPSGVVVGGHLDLSESAVESLPSDLTVGGTLILRGSSIMRLPARLAVGSLDLSGSFVTSLPPGLRIEGDLVIGETFTSFDGIDIGGRLMVNRDPGKKTYSTETRTWQYELKEYSVDDAKRLMNSGFWELPEFSDKPLFGYRTGR